MTPTHPSLHLLLFCRYIGAPLLAEEAERLATLRSYDVMDTARDNRVLDRITSMLAQVREQGGGLHWGVGDFAWGRAAWIARRL